MTDVNDFDLEDLMAELEAQNAQIEDPKPEPTPEPIAVVPEPEPEPVVVEPEPVVVAPKPEPTPVPPPAVEVSSDLDAELEAFMAADLEPKSVDHLSAEQSVDLGEVFDEPTVVQAVVEAASAVAEVTPPAQPQEPVATQPEPQPESALEKTPEPQPQTPVVAEPAAIPATLPDADDKPVMTEKAATERAKLMYRPDIDAFQARTKVTDATLDRCMNDQASLMAFQAAEYARAEHQVAKAKLEFEVLEAGLYDRYRTIAIEAGEKVTEKAIENAVRRDRQWKAAKLLLIEAQAYADIHKGFVSSLRDRRDMLIQRGADRREEMKGQVRTMDKGYSTTTPLEQPEQQAEVDVSNLTLAQRIALKSKNTLSKI